MNITEKRIQDLPMASTHAVVACNGEPNLTNYEGPVVALCDKETYGRWEHFDDYILRNRPEWKLEDPAIKMAGFSPSIHLLTKWMVACILDPVAFTESVYKEFVKPPIQQLPKGLIIHRVSNSELYTAEDLVDHSGVAVVIKDSVGNVLMQKHVKIGKWTIPAGKVLPNGTLEVTIRAEMFEETGLWITECKFLKDRMFVYQKNGVIVNTHSHVFEAVKYTGVLENKEPEKHSEQLFMSFKDIRKLPNLSDVTMLWLGIPDRLLR